MPSLVNNRYTHVKMNGLSLELEMPQIKKDVMIVFMSTFEISGNILSSYILMTGPSKSEESAEALPLRQLCKLKKIFVALLKTLHRCSCQ